MGIGVLGPVRVDGDARTLAPRDRVVLAALALRPGETVGAERLADALWGERPPASWAKVIQGSVVRLRKVLGVGAIETARRGYRLVLPVEAVDAQRFERLVRRGRELLTLEEPERAAHAITEALGLWRGPALVDAEGWDPARIEATRLEELRLDAQEALVDAALRAGRHREVLAEVQARVAEAPLRERRWALLALAQYQAGRQGEALRTLHRARTVLASELGLEPGPDLVALEGAILRHDPSLAPDAALPEPSTTCPYPGLVPYEVADADGFFGRDADVAACLRRLATTGVLAVVGPSGSGKSSLVRAGVAAALGRNGRRVMVVTPGPHPSDALTALPGGAGLPPVLVVDQCEEALVLCDDGDEQARFFAALAAHAERGPLVVALRADRMGELSAHPSFARLIEPGLYLLGAMGEDDLRAAIEGPARQAGLLLEPGLVELLVREAEGEPGALPLLSHALRTTWERREGSTLTVDGYRDTGGIRGAVAQSAEELYEQVTPDQRPLVRDLLLRLVAPSADGEPVRNRVSRRIIGADPAHEELVEVLIAARLVTSDDGVVQLAHEALARAWPRLRSWLDDDSEGQRVLRHLTGAAETWDAMGRPDSELYRGARLAQALDWHQRRHPDLTAAETAFLTAGQALADSERQAAERRARHQARQNRRLRSLLSVAVSERERARREGRIATARELAAAANASLEMDAERSVLLALAAVEHTRSADGSVLPEAEEALHRAVTACRIELRVPGVGGRLDWSPDGSIFVTEGPEGSGVVDVRDARTGESVRSFRGHDRNIHDVAFNHDGTLLATTGADGAARIWDPTTGEELHALQSSSDDVWGPSFSGDGSLFAAAWHGEGVVKILDLATGRIVREIRSVPGPSRTSFDPTRARVAVSSYVEPTAVVVDVESGDEVFSLEGHRLKLLDVAWSPDGGSIATASLDGSARIFDARTGRHRFAVLGRGGAVLDLCWSPDSTRLVTTATSGTASVWLLTEGGPREILTLSAHDTNKGITGAVFSSDGTRVMTGDVGITAVSIWDVSITGGAELANLPTAAIWGAVAYTPDGRHLVASGPAGSATVWDAQTFTSVRSLGAHARPASAPSPTGRVWDGPLPTSGTAVVAVGVSRDGQLVAAARSDGSVRVWDLQNGRDAFTVDPGPCVLDVAWHPAGDLLAIATGDNRTRRMTGAPRVRREADRIGRVTIVDRSGHVVTAWQEDAGVAVGSVAFSADGRHLITSRVPVGSGGPNVGELAIWDWKDAEIEHTMARPVRNAVASPTGSLVASATQGGRGETVDVWDSATGQHVATLAGHTWGAGDLAFSPDGSRLATGGWDGTVRIWDPYSGDQLLVLRGHYTAVTSVAFSPDGSQLASVGAEQCLRVWALDLDDLVEIAESRLTRSLTDEECRQYLHVPRCP